MRRQLGWMVGFSLLLLVYTRCNLCRWVLSMNTEDSDTVTKANKEKCN